MLSDTQDVCPAPVGSSRGPFPILDEVVDRDAVGQHTGQVKWFNDSLGYGFVTMCSGPDKGKDVFAHHSGIRPASSNYKTLKKGEYVNFNLIGGQTGPQAIDITGICGGALMCDIAPPCPEARVTCFR